MPSYGVCLGAKGRVVVKGRGRPFAKTMRASYMRRPFGGSKVRPNSTLALNQISLEID